MKHTALVTVFLVSIFIITQIVGLALVNKAIPSVQYNPTTGRNESQIVDSLASIIPKVEHNWDGALWLVVGITIGTILVLLLAKFEKPNWWKLWFFLAVTITISISLRILINILWVAVLIAVFLAVLKIWKPNVIIHNLTEILMYSGIAFIFFKIFNIFWIIMVLIAISIYDIIAVWHSKHMVRMARFQAESNVFAGLMIPYRRKEKKIVTSFAQKSALGGEKHVKKHAPEVTTAILGGGDVAFPLIFTCVILNRLIEEGTPRLLAFSQSMIITITTAIALTLLFVFAKKDKFYPAMPFITAGCLVGWIIVLLL